MSEYVGFQTDPDDDNPFSPTWRFGELFDAVMNGDGLDGTPHTHIIGLGCGPSLDNPQIEVTDG